MLCPVCQRYNLKAIHNEGYQTEEWLRAVSGMSKIQSEPSVFCELGEAKAIHNISQYLRHIESAVSGMSKIQSEPGVIWGLGEARATFTFLFLRSS